IGTAPTPSVVQFRPGVVDLDSALRTAIQEIVGGKLVCALADAATQAAGLGIQLALEPKVTPRENWALVELRGKNKGGEIVQKDYLVDRANPPPPPEAIDVPGADGKARQSVCLGDIMMSELAGLLATDLYGEAIPGVTPQLAGAGFTIIGHL